MDLENFIKETLVAVKKGVNLANKEFGETTSFVIYAKELDESLINFDVAVTASSEKNINGGGGIKVAMLEFGVDKDSKKLQETVSRIKFCVKVANPIK